MIHSRPPGFSGIDKVVSDWIKIQSFVSVQVWSLLSDVDGLKDFSREVLVLRLLLKNLDVIPVYLVGVFTPCHMFINVWIYISI